MNELFLEKAWDDLLSRDPDRIVNRYDSLDTESRKTVLAHLQKMVSEDGWHPEQVASAQSALVAITER